MILEYELIQSEEWNPKELIEELKAYSLRRFPKMNWDKVHIEKINTRKVILTQSDDEQTESMLNVIHQDLLRNPELTKGYAARGL